MSLSYRDLRGLQEMKAAYDLQHLVWGDDDLADPPDLMMVVQSEGGCVAGAFDGDVLAGYVFAFPTKDPDVQHSHRLAVRPEYRSFGLGAGLKHYQRDWCAARGIKIIRWTYDPLIARNANLNINRLGAVGRSYHVNYYGAAGRYNGGVDTDRVVAEWHVQGRPQTSVEDRLRIPSDFLEMLAQDGPAAEQARLSCRAAMLQRFEAGLVIVDFERDSCSYGFGRIA